MADIVYRANLATASFPFLSELFGRSIIVKQQDQNVVKALAPGEAGGDDLGIPQLYYCHNVIPTDSGYKSVGYTEINGIQYPASKNLNNVLTLRDSNGNSAQITTDALGGVFLLLEGTTAWGTGTNPPNPALIIDKRMTVAFVSGTTYIYFESVGCYTYDFATNTFSTQALAGLTAADVLGLIANRGYMIAYTDVAVFWSSTTDPTDFVPSLITGAGGGQLEGARGRIVTIESVYGGFITFTAGNAVSAIASDNARFPYNFMEITGCGGLADPNFVSYDSNSASVYAYTTSGLQAVSLRQAVIVFPEVTDFISGGLIEDFDETALVLSIAGTAGAVLKKKLVIVASRYLVISYGIGALTHALYYDGLLKQWGRLKFTHTDCFEWNRSGTEIPKKSLAFLGASGSLHVLNTDINAPATNGIMIVGKFQYVRTRLLQLQRVALENIETSGNTFWLYDLPALDGKNFGTAIIGYLAANHTKYREYLFHNTAMNHSLLFKGQFHAVSLVLTFNVSGQR